MHLKHMMQRQPIVRFRKKESHALPEGVSAADMAVAQLLGMAGSAGFRFDLVDSRLTVISANGDWRLWSAVSACLDDLGTEAVVGFFERYPPERRVALSKSASRVS